MQPLDLREVGLLSSPHFRRLGKWNVHFITVHCLVQTVHEIAWIGPVLPRGDGKSTHHEAVQRICWVCTWHIEYTHFETFLRREVPEATKIWSHLTFDQTFISADRCKTEEADFRRIFSRCEALPSRHACRRDYGLEDPMNARIRQSFDVWKLVDPLLDQNRRRTVKPDYEYSHINASRNKNLRGAI